MKLLKPTLLAAATTLALLTGGTTLAQMQHKDAAAQHGQMSQHRGEHRSEHRAAHKAERQQQLKAALKLSPAQESAWVKYVQAQQRPQHTSPPDRQAWAQLSTPQRLDQMQAQKGVRDAHMAQMIEATRSLYAALDPEQQKVFDSLVPTAGMGMGKGGKQQRGGHGGHGGHGMHHGG